MIEKCSHIPILLCMPESLINRRTAITFCCGLIISLSVFFLLKNWEENNRLNEFNYKAQDHAAAIQTEFEHVIKNIAEVRYLIEHQININHYDPSLPERFMPMAEQLIIDDSSLLSIIWTLRQQNPNEKQHLTILYLKNGSHNPGDFDDLQLNEAYDQHVLNFNIFDQKSLINSFIHKDTAQYNELNFVAPVADRMQNGSRFKGKHLGSLIVEMNISGLIERAITKLPVSTQDISLHILHPDRNKQTVYKHISRSRSPKEKNIHTSLRTNVEFEFSGLQWQLEFEAAPKFLRTHPVVLAWQSLILGLLLTFFWVWYAHFTRKQTLLIEREVVARTDALNKSKNKLRRIIDNLQDVYFQTDPDGLIKACSASVIDLLGYSELHVTGSSIQQFHRDKNALGKLFTALQDSPQGKVFNFECDFLHKDGHRIWTSSNAQFIYDNEQHITGIEGTIRDITAKKNDDKEKETIQRQLEHAQRLESLGILAGGIAHDFNNILAAIMGNASLADHKVLEHPNESKVHLDKIMRASEKASSLCQQMLAYAGEGSLTIEPINLSSLLHETTDLLNVSISPNVRIHYHLHDALPYIDGDATQLQQLLMNFTTNANEAIDEQGEITISTGIHAASHIDLKRQIASNKLVSNEIDSNKNSSNKVSPNTTDSIKVGPAEAAGGDYVFITFADNGCGMDEETIGKIFDPFFSTKFTGRGLGMSAVLGIIKSHHGYIQVDSRPGHGTSFTVHFPISPKQPNQKKETTSPSPTLQPAAGVVLVIDDDENILEVAQAMLEDSGWNSMSATDGESGIELFRQHHAEITAIILDMTMPGLNGLATLEGLQAIAADVKIILSSGYSEQKASQHFAGKGIVGFLQKPYSLEQLQRQISAINAR